MTYEKIPHLHKNLVEVLYISGRLHSYMSSMADSLFLEFFCFDFLAVIKISLVFLVLMVPTSLYFDQSNYIGQLHSLGKFILSSSYQIVSKVHMNVAYGLIGHCGLLNMLMYHFIYL